MCPKERSVSSEVTHETIAKRLNLARTTVTRIINNDPTYRASKATREKVCALAMELGYDYSNLRRIHRRRFPRRLADVEAQVRVVLEDGKLFDEGQCKVRNISLAGALLGDVRLTRAVLPLHRATVHMEVKEGPLSGLPLWGYLRRYSYGKEVEVGIVFEDMETSLLSQLSKVLEKFRLQPFTLEKA